MGTMSLINVLALMYLLPIVLLWRTPRRGLGIMLVILLSWLGFAIHRIAIVRATRRAA